MGLSVSGYVFISGFCFIAGVVAIFTAYGLYLYNEEELRRCFRRLCDKEAGEDVETSAPRPSEYPRSTEDSLESE